MNEEYPTPDNNTADLFAQLAKEGKLIALDTPDHLETNDKLNNYIREARRQFLEKIRRSEISASEFILNA